jgi:periplasmic protein TonB
MTARTAQTGFDPRAAIASLLAHGLAFGAVAAAATLGGVAAPPSPPAIQLIEIAVAPPVETPAAPAIEAPVPVQAVAPEPIVERAAIDEPPPAPVSEPEPVALAEAVPPPVETAEALPTPPVVQPAPPPKPRPKPIARKPVEAAPSPAIVQAPEPVEAAAPISTPAPVAALPSPPVEASAPIQTAAVAALSEPSAREILVTSDARFRSPPAAPVYPTRARHMGIEGTTVLRALVGETGDTLELIVWQGSGLRLLDDAALAAARQWRFEPARRGDRLLTAWVEVPVRFVLR